MERFQIAAEHCKLTQVDMRESDVLRQILDYYAARHILAFRLSTGAFFDHGRAFRSHSLGPGASDILVPATGSLWIECKSPRGRQRPSQREFEQRMIEYGQRYVLARSIDDLVDVD